MVADRARSCFKRYRTVWKTFIMPFDGEHDSHLLQDWLLNRMMREWFNPVIVLCYLLAFALLLGLI
jgi:hypothetical protein